MRADVAYAAGVFEGEGAIQLMRFRNGHGTDYYALRTVVAICDREILEWLQAHWGGRIYTQQVAEGHRAQWRWIITATATRAFLTDIRPYLKSKRVSDKVALALEFQTQKNPRGRRATGNYNERQRAYYDRMKVLNLRGDIGARMRELA